MVETKAEGTNERANERLTRRSREIETRRATREGQPEGPRL